VLLQTSVLLLQVPLRQQSSPASPQWRHVLINTFWSQKTLAPVHPGIGQEDGQHW
jgi:hypothetical protein